MTTVDFVDGFELVKDDPYWYVSKDGERASVNVAHIFPIQGTDKFLGKKGTTYYVFDEQFNREYTLSDKAKLDLAIPKHTDAGTWKDREVTFDFDLKTLFNKKANKVSDVVREKDKTRTCQPW